MVVITNYNWYISKITFPSPPPYVLNANTQLAYYSYHFSFNALQVEIGTLALLWQFKNSRFHATVPLRRFESLLPYSNTVGIIRMYIYLWLQWYFNYIM